MIKNYMEVFVDNTLSEVIKKYKNICKCHYCLEDIKAIALNNLKPIYVSTKDGDLYTRINELEFQFKTDIVKELTFAIEIVSKKTRHEANRT
ncbi:late competence development ComFB family protein [Clostridium sp. MSJ-4]|uniref:Late competence development ComFB family protein n=1 Tax=Clostridium simiarum TaxID=2841506 RepID=A0ABS6EYA4_9CLOT|nr:late competence development ComFB family protein [Clostridium simiarum]MBU5590347.1 late competence development ComFB family protein [Clostridium simiarum]